MYTLIAVETPRPPLRDAASGGLAVVASSSTSGGRGCGVGTAGQGRRETGWQLGARVSKTGGSGSRRRRREELEGRRVLAGVCVCANLEFC
jgi:hypothetical protein